MKSVLLVLVLLGATGVSVGLFHSGAASEAVEPHPAASLAGELGFDPESLAVAGFDAVDAEALLDRLAQATTLQSDLIRSKTSAQQAAFGVSEAAEQLSRDPENAELRDAYLQARANLASANNAIVTVRSDLIVAALDGALPSQAEDWRICAASIGRKIPAAFRALPLTLAGAENLEECLIAESRASRLGTAVPPEMAQRLAATRGDMDVVVADQRLASHLVAIEAVFAGQ